MKYLLAGTLLIACLAGCISNNPSDALLDLVSIPEGKFCMGSPPSEKGRYASEGQVWVTISAFKLGKTEVTQRQWEKIMGTNPSKHKNDDFPVDSVSWYDAMEFCKALTELGHRFGRLPKNMKFTLPTEAQWEYACRAGTTTRFHTGDTEAVLAKYEHFSGKRRASLDSPARVASYLPNPWGLYDMHGNVSEWCLDYHNSLLLGGKNPCRTAPKSPWRSIRGGNWHLRDRKGKLQGIEWARSAMRFGDAPDVARDAVGFRVALVEIGREEPKKLYPVKILELPQK